MRRIVFASACILAISAGGAFAQTQPAPGASSQGNVGPGAVQDARKDEMKKGATTGAGRADKSMGTSAAPSSSGNVGPGTNNNTGPQPGGR
jgi:hypothetical protein